MFRYARPIGALLCFALLNVAGARAASFDPAPYLQPQRLISIGRHSINVYCTGRGSPTVVLGSDGDDPTSAWRFVQPAVARKTRVCSYDPPGFGFSTASAVARDADHTATDLHTLLVRSGITGPIVFVGYANSGFTARVYADRYPHDVAGMVLVSPDIPNQERIFAKVAPALATMLDIKPFLKNCLGHAQAGSIRPGTRAYARCVYSPPDPTIPRPLLDRIHQQWQRPGLWASFRAEMLASEQSSREVIREQRSYGKMPLIVLSTTKDIGQLPIPSAQKAALQKAWVALHQQIAKLSSRGVDLVIPDATQALPIERPTDVVAAIDRVVRAIRQ